MTLPLIERLETAKVGSRELDGLIWFAVYEPDVDHGCLHVEQTDQGPREVLTCELGSKWAPDIPAYTASLDAALSLAGRGGWPFWSGGQGTQNAWAHIYDRHPDQDGPTFNAQAATPALALCAAILKAKGAGG